MATGPSLAIGLATFHRPDRLATLLPRLVEQLDGLGSDDGPVGDQRILVIDNDPHGSARSVVEDAGDARIRYTVEPRPGISSARNRILDEAADSDILVLIDDDETPHSGWLSALLATRSAHGADAISGPVEPRFEGGEDPWIIASGSYLGQVGAGRPTGTVLQRAATNNLLLDMGMVRDLGLRFDPSLGLTGGEDSYFTGQLTAAGGRIVWCAEATVTDLVPADRNTRRYNLWRRCAQSASHVRVEQMLTGSRSARVRGWLRWVVIGLGQIVKGAALAARGAVLHDLRSRAVGESRIASGSGVLLGCLGIRPAPYKRRPATTSSSARRRR